MAELVKKALTPFKFFISFFSKLIKKYGWKAAVGIFIFYLIRDSLLYIIIPFFVAKSIFF